MPALLNLGGVLAGNLPFHTQSTLILEILSEPGQGKENDVLRSTTIAIAKKLRTLGRPSPWVPHSFPPVSKPVLGASTTAANQARCCSVGSASKEEIIADPKIS